MSWIVWVILIGAIVGIGLILVNQLSKGKLKGKLRGKGKAKGKLPK